LRFYALYARDRRRVVYANTSAIEPQYLKRALIEPFKVLRLHALYALYARDSRKVVYANTSAILPQYLRALIEP
jgi:hypothetical protein